jgi:cytochrome c553
LQFPALIGTGLVTRAGDFFLHLTVFDLEVPVAQGHTPKVDSSAKFVGLVGTVLLLAAIYYLVTSLIHVVTGQTYKNEFSPGDAPTAASATSAPASPTPEAASSSPAPTATPVAAVSGGDAAAGKTKYATCAACHGADGKGNGGAFPNLTKLNAADAEAILHAFKKGDKAYLSKHGLGGARYGTMAPQAAGLSDADIADLAAYIAELGGHSASAAEPAAAPAAATSTTASASTGDAAAGKTKYATCAACHGADGKGNGGAFPNLTKLNAADAEAILHAFKKGDKEYLAKHGLGGARYGTMAPQAAGLSDADIADLGAYIAELGGHSASAAPAAAEAAPAAKPAAAAAPTQKIVSSEVVAWGHALFSSCAVCHGAEGEGGKLFAAPKLAGLPYDSVVSLLNLYRKGQQMGANSYAMIPQAKHLTDSEINALASYIAVMNNSADHGATATE